MTRSMLGNPHSCIQLGNGFFYGLYRRMILSTLTIFSVVGKAHCNPTDRPTCSTAPFHLDFCTADCYVMRLQVTRDTHLFPISSPGQAAKQQTGPRGK